MTSDFRAKVEEWPLVLASDAEAQLSAVDGLPEELRLIWDDCYYPVNDRGPAANPDGIAQFTAAERTALNEFDDYMRSLPPEPDPMWHRDALKKASWPDVRAKASDVLERLRSSATR